MTSRISARILVVDEERHQLDTICRGLRLYGYHCTGVDSIPKAYDMLSKEDARIDLMLIEPSMLGRRGLELIDTARHRTPTLPVVAISGLAPRQDTECLRFDNVTLLKKPFDPEILDATVRAILKLESV